jgi:cell division protein FtsB
LKRAAALVAATLVIWALLLLIGGRAGILATLRSRAMLDELEQQIRRQEGVNDKLREEIRQLEQDDHAVEKVAREDLLMIRPDEVMLVVPDVPVAETDPVVEGAPVAAEHAAAAPSAP